MILSFSRNFAFVHIHKCAGSSVEAALGPHLTTNDFMFELPPFIPQGEILRKWSALERARFGLDMHSGANAIRRFAGMRRWDRLFTFAFVRAPVDRLHSLYRFCHDRVTKAPLTEEEADRLQRLGLFPTRPPYHLQAVRAVVEADNFSDFALHPATWMAGGARPQARSLCGQNGETLVKFIGRFERLEEDWAKVQEVLQVDAPLPSVNRTKSAAPLDLTDAARAHLIQRYREDYELLGYPPGS